MFVVDMDMHMRISLKLIRAVGAFIIFSVQVLVKEVKFKSTGCFLYNPLDVKRNKVSKAAKST